MSYQEGFVEVVVKDTGDKQWVPAHYMEHPVLSRPFEFPPSAKAATDGKLEEPAGDTPPATDPTTTTKRSRQTDGGSSGTDN